MWYRVFGNESPIQPAALLQHLEQSGLEVTANFRADDQGWFRADFLLAGEEEPIKLERYLAAEEGIRPELNSWAAWLESVPHNPHQARLMQHMIGSQQVFTLFRPPAEQDEPLRELCLAICQFLARETQGVYQEDGRGFFEADGVLLVHE
jgi:hypothetical protein